MEQRNYFPSFELLHELFEYRDGKLYNKIARNSRTKIGNVSGSYSSRYALVTINGVPWQISRVIFMMHHNYLPKYVDHINGNKHDNRIENLRAATPHQNQCNHPLQSKNKSGVKGVSWIKKYQKWYACIRVNGKTKNLGMFDNLELAKEFIELARETLHGNFANHGSFKENISCQ